MFPAPQPVVNGFNGYDLRSNLTPQNQYSFRVDHNFNPSNSVFFRYTSSDQTRIGTGGIVGETATGETFGKQYVLSYYHQFNPSTILDAQFGHVDLTNNVGNAYDNLDPTTVVNDAGLAPGFACGFTGTAGCSIPGLNIPCVRDYWCHKPWRNQAHGHLSVESQFYESSPQTLVYHWFRF